MIKKVWYCYTCHAHGDLTGEARLSEPNYAVMKHWMDKKLAEGHVYPESWLSRWDAGPVHPYWAGSVGGAAATTSAWASILNMGPVTYPLRDSCR